eukprot:3204574-Ditylum_brightwellii.AAC.1
MADKCCKKRATGSSKVDMAQEDAEQSKEARQKGQIVLNLLFSKLMVSGQQVVLCNVVGIVGFNAVYDVGVIP